MEKDKIIKSIQEIKIKLNQIELELKEEKIETPEKSVETPEKVETGNQLNEFENLKNLLKSEEWPEAVLDFQIVDESSEEEKNDRAEGIIDILIEEELENKKLLDFGCGEGHMAKYASTQKTAYSMGNDLVKTSKSKLNWEIEENNYMLTTDFEKVKEKGPYDIIIVYDVLDHAEDPKDVLDKVKSVLSDDGKVYLRCHPWCGRHGGHYYRQINKAFVNLVFTESELEQMNYKLEEKNTKVLFPIATYNKIIEDAGLVKIKEDIERQDVEEFFINNKLTNNRLSSLYKDNGFNQFPKFQMEMCFIDYTLRK